MQVGDYVRPYLPAGHEELRATYSVKGQITDRLVYSDPDEIRFRVDWPSGTWSWERPSDLVVVSVVEQIAILETEPHVPNR